MAFNWVCPHCDRPQVVTDTNHHFIAGAFHIGGNKLGKIGYNLSAIACLNKECRMPSISFGLFDRVSEDGNYLVLANNPTKVWKLIPESSAKPQPDYIPASLVEDYHEACIIRDKSPKASATLARRCIQGMIRDFCGIRKDRLIDEIYALRTALNDGNAPKGVELESVEAIDAIRSIGNIGAHMEKDVNLIIDVEPDEAQSLIELIEMLFEEWYVARHLRQEKLARVLAVAADKKKLIADGRAEAKALLLAPKDGT